MQQELQIDGRCYEIVKGGFLVAISIGREELWIDSTNLIFTLRDFEGFAHPHIWYRDKQTWVVSRVGVGKTPLRSLKPSTVYRSTLEGRDWAINHRSAWIESEDGTQWMFGYDGLWYTRKKDRIHIHPQEVCYGPLEKKLRPAYDNWDD